MSAFRYVKKLSQNRYFLSVTMLSFFVFILLTSFALLASFSIYRTDVKRKALTLQVERLNSYAKQIDIKYNKILSSADQLVSDKSVLEWIYEEDGDKDKYLLWTILDRLNYISVFNDAVYSLEVYNARSGSVLSNYYGYNAGSNDNKFMEGRRPLYMDFMNNNNIKQLVISSEEINNTPTPTIILLNSLPAYKKSGAVGMVIQANRLLPHNISSTEYIYVVDSKNPSVYFSNNTSDPVISGEDIGVWIRKLLEEDTGNDMRAFEINGMTYYSAHRNMFNNRFKLLTLVPEAGIEVTLNSFSAYFTVALLLILVLSVLCSFLIYRTAHKPIKKIVESVSGKMNNIYINKSDAYYSDDLKYLDNTFNMIISKNSEIEKIFLDHKEFFKENALRNLIYGKSDEDVNLFYGNSYLRSGLNNFIILIFNSDSHPLENSAYILENFDLFVLKELTGKYDVSYLRTGFRQYTVLINLKRIQDRGNLLEDVRQLQDSIREKYGSTVTVGVSSVRNKIEDICLCYDEAQEAVKYKTLLGNDRIIDSMQLQNEKSQTNSFSIQEGQILVKKLRTEGEKEISETIIKMINEKKQQYSIELLNAFLLYISFCIGQVGIEYNISPDIVLDNNLFKIMIEYDTIEEKKAYLINQCKKIIEVRNNKQKKYKKLSGEIAIKYIEENYNKPISLDIVSAELRMSTSYLSRLIKQELGMNFVAYLNKLRIDKAIELLRKEQHTAKVISALVGYDNEHTFIRNFKSITGKTPADYRNSVMHTAYLKKKEGVKNL